MKPSCAPGQTHPGPAASETRGAELPVPSTATAGGDPRPRHPPGPPQPRPRAPGVAGSGSGASTWPGTVGSWRRDRGSPGSRRGFGEQYGSPAAAQRCGGAVTAPGREGSCPRHGGLSSDGAVSPSRAGLSALRPPRARPHPAHRVPRGVPDSPCPGILVPCPLGHTQGCGGPVTPRQMMSWQGVTVAFAAAVVAKGSPGSPSAGAVRGRCGSGAGSGAGAVLEVVRGKGDSAAFPALKFNASCSILLRRR